MSLKFGIYLVEQRIISPEQFCGLVKIQQEATKGVPTLAVEKNFLTIKQVATILDVREITPSKPFILIAIELDYLDKSDANQLLREEQLSCPAIEKLVVECGLLTGRQAAVLSHHFQRQPQGRSTVPQEVPPQVPAQVPTPHAAPETAVTGQHSGNAAMRPRQPKFQQRPVVVRPYTSHATQRDFSNQ